jgi:catechol 2,3-dioxygenase-like lactoylglutathione lyase family enzyme
VSDGTLKRELQGIANVAIDKGVGYGVEGMGTCEEKRVIIAGRLDHVAIAAESTDAMVKWYEEVLGLVVHAVAGPNPPQTQKIYLIGPPVPRGSRSAEDGIVHGMMIEVMPRNGVVRHERGPTDPGLSHVAWYVADFDGALGHLKAKGVRFLSEIVQAVGGGRIISFADCEGNMTQIVERVTTT